MLYYNIRYNIENGEKILPRTQKRVKKFEKRFANNVTHKTGNFFKAFGGLFVRIFRVFDSKLTIMIVPHSHGKVINFQTNVFAILLGFFVSIGVISSFIYFNRRAFHFLESSRSKVHLIHHLIMATFLHSLVQKKLQQVPHASLQI